jgi:hypothetical protein
MSISPLKNKVYLRADAEAGALGVSKAKPS